MSLLNTTLESPAVAIPFKVRMEPYLVESICELARLVRDKGASANDISGLLFGKAEPGNRSVEALKTFVDMGAHSELARRQRWEKAYATTAEEAKSDPELSELEIVGWFSFRTASGLLSSDVVFHNQHFRKAEDIALIIWREGPSQITAEVYSKSEDDKLSSDDYRWGSVRLSADIRHMRESVELAMRMRLNEDSYLRTYQNDEPVSHLESLKRRAEAVSDRLFGFLNKGKDEADLAKVRGLIGDGRLPGRSRPTIDAMEPPFNHQLYFNPYSDPVIARNNRLTLEDSAKSAAASTKAETGVTALPVAAPPSAWPSSGTGFGTAPARAPEFQSDFHFPEGNFPPSPDLENSGLQHSGLELSEIGRAPRSGRAPVDEIGGLPMSLRPVTSRKRFPWVLITSVFLLCSSLVFGFLVLGGLQGENGRLGQIIQMFFPGDGLNLRVHNEDDRLRLSWNQHNRSVSSATDATLQILDGQVSREIHLEGRQVADGSVLYRPLTNDVSFRLDVHSDQGSTSGSVRVLDSLAGRQSTLDVSAPPSGTSLAAPYGLAAAAGNSTVPAPLRDGTVPIADPANSGANSIPQTAPSTPGTGTSPLTAYVPPAVASNVIPPATGATGVNAPSQTTAPLAKRPGHYETPATVDTIQPVSGKPAGQAASPALSGGTTINGWDAVPSSKSKTRFTAPRPLAQVTPDVRSLPAGAIPIRTRVAVQVSIDASGRVVTAHVLTAGINSRVAASALAAAREWTFDPALSNGHPIGSHHQIVFEFPAH